jgi:uncharacterized protein (DUF433 family)
MIFVCRVMKKCVLGEDGGIMETQTRYVYLESRPDKQTQELFIRGTGVRASTIWHDRYISRIAPEQIARSRELAEEAVMEALAYCQDYWNVICTEKDAERMWLEAQGFFAESSQSQ